MRTSTDGTMVADCLTRIDLPSADNGIEDARRNAPNCFVAGPENRLAAATLAQLLHGDNSDNAVGSAAISPLVLFGPSGSGKSLLARGVVRHWRERPQQRNELTAVAYLTASDFGRQLHTARAEDSLTEFREQLSQAQLLVIEDLQRLSPRAFVQRELRDTIDAVVAAGGVVLVTTQPAPGTYTNLDRGLCDRLQAGLVVQLRPPGIEAREEILSLAADARQMRLPENRLQQLAQQVEGPVPRLFQALAKLELKSAGQSPISIPDNQPLSFKQILAVVARYFSLTQVALCSASRRRSLVHARGVAVHLARTLTDLSYAHIGQSLGNRDHSTIAHADHKIRQLLNNDPTTQQTIDHLHRILTTV